MAFKVKKYLYCSTAVDAFAQKMHSFEVSQV